MINNNILPGISKTPLNAIKVSLPQTRAHPEEKCGSPADILNEFCCGVALGGLEINWYDPKSRFL